MISNFINKFEYLYGDSVALKRSIINRDNHRLTESQTSCSSPSRILVRTQPYKQNMNDCSMQENEDESFIEDNYYPSLNDSQLPTLN